MKKIGQFSSANISGTTDTISVKFGMWGEVYGKHKIYKFGGNWFSNFELREVEIGDFSVLVNNTCVLRATFLATQHMTVCLNITSWCIFLSKNQVLVCVITLSKTVTGIIPVVQWKLIAYILINNYDITIKSCG